MMLAVNDEEFDVATISDLEDLLLKIKSVDPLEAWLSVEEGPSLCMLRTQTFSWLMYLREPGDSGFYSLGEAGAEDREQPFTLANGQVDHYPENWCVPFEHCLAAFRSFWHGNGQRPSEVRWLAH